MTDKLKDRAARCVTHHAACDCREYAYRERIERLEGVLRRVKERITEGDYKAMGVLDLLGGYECPKCGGSGRIPVIDLGVGEVIDKVPCPVCRPDDTPRRDALEAFKRISRKAGEAALFLSGAEPGGAIERQLNEDRETVRRAITTPAVPESVRRLPGKWVRRADDWALSYSDEMRGQLRTDAHELQHEIDQALAQHSEPGRIPEGWKLVPVEPTREMRMAFHKAQEEVDDSCRYVSPDHQWNAMLAAAPAPDADEREGS